MFQWLYRSGGDFTAEAPFDVAQDKLRTRRKKFLIKKNSELCELCELCASVVKTIFSVAALPRCALRRSIESQNDGYRAAPPPILR